MGNEAMHRSARRLHGTLGLAGLLLAGLTSVSAGNAWAEQAPGAAVQAERAALVAFDIPAQPLDSAMLAFAEQAGIQVFFDDSKLAGLHAHALEGRHTPQEALRRLLDGLPISYSFMGERRVNLQRLVAAAGDALQLDPTTVDARREAAGDWVYQAPRAVSEISREQLDQRPPRHAADMLVDVPGVTSAVNRNNPGLSVNIRGMQDFGRVNMMIDGMRQNHVESGHQQRNGEMYVDPELLSRVVVEKGLSSGQHGAQAIAGAVDFRTLDYDDIIRPGQDHGVRVRAGHGIGGRANGVGPRGSVAAAGRFEDRLELLLATSRRRLGEYQAGERGLKERDLRSRLDVLEMRFAHQDQESLLAKTRLHLNDDHQLQLTLNGTRISYANVSDQYSPSNPQRWKPYGDARARTGAYALDWAFAPEDPLFDLKAKLYHVRTDNRRVTEPDFRVNSIWNGEHERDCSEASLNKHNWDVVDSCISGLTRTNTSRTDTLGLQLENTSRLALPQIQGELAANYGMEWFQDQGKSHAEFRRAGFSVGHLEPFTRNNHNPGGRRDVASAFSSLTFKREPLTLKAGLRYDWYHLRGRTEVRGVENGETDRLTLFTRSFCDARRMALLKDEVMNPPTLESLLAKKRAENEREKLKVIGGMVSTEAQMLRSARREFSRYQDRLKRGDAGEAFYNWKLKDCEQARQGNIAGLSPEGKARYESPNYAPSFEENPAHYPYKVDKRAGNLSPSLGAAWQVLDGVELFGTWGRGVRPPALTEVLWEGAHSGKSFTRVFPNPQLSSETATTWELGVNLLQRDLWRTDDRLGVKLTHFATKVDHFIYTGMGNGVPGSAQQSLFNIFFNNNLEQTRYRGLELEGHYDAGIAYGRVNATRYQGKANTFCHKTWPLGSQVTRFDRDDVPSAFSHYRPQALAAGHASYQAKLDAQRTCGMIYNSALFIPLDRQSALLGVRPFERKLDMGLRYNRQQNRKNRAWDSSTTWDLFGHYQVQDNLALQLAVENLRDESYRSDYADQIAFTPSPGRTVQAGLELRF